MPSKAAIDMTLVLLLIKGNQANQRVFLFPICKFLGARIFKEMSRLCTEEHIMHSFEKAENNKNNNDRIYDAGMLSDRDIRTFWKKGIEVEVADVQNYSFDIEKQLQHGSIDLRFRHDYKKISIPRNQVLTFEKMKNHEYTTSGEVSKNNKLILEPGEMILTTTMETVRLSENFAGIITGRSRIARLGIMVHC